MGLLWRVWGVTHSAGSVVPWIKVNRFPGGAVLTCTACGEEVRVTEEYQIRQFMERHTDHTSPAGTHYGLGDVVAGAAKAVGAKPCSGCEQRRVDWNRAFPKIWRR